VEKQKKASKEKHDWIAELEARGEVQMQDPGEFASQLQMDKTATMTKDGGARPNPGSEGWGVLIRQNGKFICVWKHYDKASNNAMEISAVIAGLTFLSPGMVVWLLTYSQYVQKGINEWMPKWKRNG
jgi:ribonuclease HI